MARAKTVIDLNSTFWFWGPLRWWNKDKTVHHCA